MRKIVFFYKNLSSIYPELMEFLSVAGEMAKDPENQVYFIAPPNNHFVSRIKQLNIRYFNVNSNDFSAFEQSIIITPLSCAIYLAEVAKKLENARVLFLELSDWDSTQLLNEQNLFSIPMDDFFETITKKNGLVFSSSFRRASLQSLLAMPFEPLYVPATFLLPEEYTYEVSDSKHTDSLVHIGVVAEPGYGNVWGLAEVLMHSDDEREFLLHICDMNITGLGRGSFTSDAIKRYSPKVRFEFAGTMESEAMIPYFKSNAQFVIANGTPAIIAAYSGVPVFVSLCYSQKVTDFNRFVPFHDLRGYSLRFSEKTAILDHLNVVTMDEVLACVSDNEQREAYAGEDYRAAETHHSITKVRDCLFEQINHNSLTIQDIVQLPSVQKTFATINAKGKKNKKIRSYTSMITQERVRIRDENPLVKQQKKAKKKEERKQKLLRPVRSVYHKYKDLKKKSFYKKIYNSYPAKIEAIRERFQKDKVLKVAFLTIFDSVFPGQPVFEKMLQMPEFDPYLIVMPDVDKARGTDYTIATYNKSLNSFLEKYGNEHVISGYDMETETYLELGEDYPIIFFANPYINMAHPYHELTYFLDKNVLPLYICYGFAALKYVRNLYELDFYNLVWKVFLESEMNYRDYVSYAPMHGKNTFVSGYVKMDELDECEIVTERRKKIIIAPHHTVMGWDKLNLSNFTRYYDFFLELAEKFPNVDFVFRPHPLLFTNLISRKMWTKQKVKEYLDAIDALPNMVYDNSGEYFDTFANSDGMIHDCGSFIGEYLFTEKPCAYMLKTKRDLDNTFLPLGDACMHNYYKAYSKEDIISFVEDVVVNGIDPLQERREKFCKQELKKFYPNSKDRVINLLLDTLTK